MNKILLILGLLFAMCIALDWIDRIIYNNRYNRKRKSFQEKKDEMKKKKALKE